MGLVGEEEGWGRDGVEGEGVSRGEVRKGT